MSDEKERGVIFTPKVEEEGRVDEFPVTNEEEINVKSVMTPEEVQGLLPKDVEVLEEITDGKPIDGIPEEPKELTEEEKKAIFIQNLKDSRIRFHPIKHPVKSEVVGVKEGVFGRKTIQRGTTVLTHITTNQFDSEYRKKRQKKNRMARASRKANR